MSTDQLKAFTPIVFIFAGMAIAVIALFSNVDAQTKMAAFGVAGTALGSGAGLSRNVPDNTDI